MVKFFSRRGRKSTPFTRELFSDRFKTALIIKDITELGITRMVLEPQNKVGCRIWIRKPAIVVTIDAHAKLNHIVFQRKGIAPQMENQVFAAVIPHVLESIIIIF
jgi:hypothetical protein